MRMGKSLRPTVAGRLSLVLSPKVDPIVKPCEAFAE
jgi:hypothetical protein